MVGRGICADDASCSRLEHPPGSLSVCRHLNGRHGAERKRASEEYRAANKLAGGSQ